MSSTPSAVTSSTRSVGPAGTTRPITVEDLRRKALQVQELAKAEARDVVADERSRVLVGALVGVAVLVSVAYFAGSRAGRARVVRAARRSAERAMQKAAEADAPLIVRV